MREKDMKLPFAYTWCSSGGVGDWEGEWAVCGLLSVFILVTTDNATKQKLPKQPEIPAFINFDYLILNVDLRWGICWR